MSATAQVEETCPARTDAPLDGRRQPCRPKCLTRLLLESSAQAALITQRGDVGILCQLGQAGACEVSTILTRSLERTCGGRSPGLPGLKQMGNTRVCRRWQMVLPWRWYTMSRFHYPHSFPGCTACPRPFRTARPCPCTCSPAPAHPVCGSRYGSCGHRAG